MKYNASARLASVGGVIRLGGNGDSCIGDGGISSFITLSLSRERSVVQYGRGTAPVDFVVEDAPFGDGWPPLGGGILGATESLREFRNSSDCDLPSENRR